MTVSRDRVLIEIHLEPVRFKNALLRLRLAAAEHRLDAGDKLHDAERLSQVVVGAEAESGYLVIFRVLGGRHNHRNVAELR